jgi:3-oxoadipate enol-lactonase
MPKLRINDIDMYYEEYGQGQPILLIHGLGSSTADWERQIPAFSNQYKVIAFDMRGHGQSEKPQGPYSMSLFASDAAELIKSLGLGPVHLIGISLGGMVSFQLAADSPELVKSMVIVNAGHEMIVRTIKDRWQVFMRTTLVRLFGMRKMGEVLSQRMFTKPEHEDIRQIFIERWSKNDPKAYLASMRTVVNWSVDEQLENIDIPTCVITADEDYSSVESKKAYVDRMPQAELVVIKDSRHATPVEHPDEFNKEVMSFLSKLA